MEGWKNENTVDKSVVLDRRYTGNQHANHTAVGSTFTANICVFIFLSFLELSKEENSIKHCQLPLQQDALHCNCLLILCDCIVSVKHR